MKATRKDIISAIKKRFNLDVELSKACGFYYWITDEPMFDRCTYMKFLNDANLNWWVDEFKQKYRR